MDKPLKLNTGMHNILDKDNTYRHVMHTMLPNIMDNQVYQLTGAELSKLIYDTVYFAHGNGRARERQVSSSPLKFIK